MDNKLNNKLEICDEDKIILLSARTQTNPQIKSNIKLLLDQSLNWDHILKMSFNHKLMPLLYWNFKEFEEKIPDNIFEKLKLNYKKTAENNLLMLGELFKLVDLFDKEDLKFIPYKGPLLAICAYNNLVLRQFDDLDIFIRKNDIFDIKRILIVNGYQPIFNLKGFKEERFIKSQREYKFFNPITNINLEIQWQFQGSSFSLSEDLSFGDLEYLKIVKIGNRNISSLSIENLLIILCIHASGHYWERLSWICDISELIQSNNIDWIYLFEKADKLGIDRILKVNLLLAVDLLDLNVPNNVHKKLKSKTIRDLTLRVKRKIFSNKSYTIFQNAKLRMDIREKKTHKVKDLLKIMFLPTNKEWNSSNTKPLLPPFSYFYRFIQVLKNY